MTEFNRLFDDLEDETLDTTTKTLRGRLTSVEDALRYMLAGKATITLESLKTKARFTYSIRASDDGKCHFVSLLTGADNESDYRYLGRISGGGITFWPGRKVPKPGDVGKDATSMKAFDWVWLKLQNGKLPETLAIWHEGRCGRCHHKLTVPSSVKQGFGPECVGRL